jgi:hypothetical protein
VNGGYDGLIGLGVGADTACGGEQAVEFQAHRTPIPLHANPKENSSRMMTDPRTVERLLSYMSKAVWLIMAYSFGTMVGKLILMARG